MHRRTLSTHRRRTGFARLSLPPVDRQSEVGLCIRTRTSHYGNPPDHLTGCNVDNDLVHFPFSVSVTVLSTGLFWAALGLQLLGNLPYTKQLKLRT